jgi:transposase InsO family protein
MGTIGDSYDNAMTESFWASLEKELIYRRSFKHTTGGKNCNLCLYQLVQQGRDGDRVSLADSVRERG